MFTISSFARRAHLLALPTLYETEQYKRALAQVPKHPPTRLTRRRRDSFISYANGPGREGAMASRRRKVR
jgi:hypothetical protein